MSTSKLKKFASFRHRRENVQDEGRRVVPVVAGRRDDRRQSYAATTAPEEGAPPPRSDFLRMLRKWKHFEDKQQKRTNMEKRRSVSTDNVTLARSVTMKPQIESELYARYRSEGDLVKAKDPLLMELKRTLAGRSEHQVRCDWVGPCHTHTHTHTVIRSRVGYN